MNTEELIKQIEIARIQEQDVIILKHDSWLSKYQKDEVYRRVKQELRKAGRSQVGIVLIDPGTDIEVLSPKSTVEHNSTINVTINAADLQEFKDVKDFFERLSARQ